MPTADGHPKVSQRKIEANRRNALRSTGPKTDRGKSIVSRNALKHGLLSARIVNEELGEEKKDVQSLHEELIEDYQPIGRMEQFLVERSLKASFAFDVWLRRRLAS
jgi:hypothetical protein